MSFNFQALDGYSPGNIYARLPGSGPHDRLAFYRSGVGSYDYFGCSALPAHVARTVPGVSGKTKFSLDEVYKVLDFHQAELDEKCYQEYEQGYLDFAQAQYDYHRRRAWRTEGDLGAAQFEARVQPLLHALSTRELLGMKVRKLENPTRCHAVSKAKLGVFMWPSWFDERTVHISMRLQSSIRPQVREILQDWLQQQSLRLAIPG